MYIFVGNLSFSATQDDVRKVFEAFGTVGSVSIKKKSGNNSRGWGFVEMPDETQAQEAIANLNGKELMGRPMEVTIKRETIAKPKKENAKAELPIKEEEEKPRPKKVFAKSRKPSGSWEKRKGKGPSKAWKKTPGGIKKKFRHKA